MVESGDYKPEVITHMIESLVESRDRRIKHLQRKAKPKVFEMTQNKITGALRQCINDHGPITKEWIGSAAKRIYQGSISGITEG